MRTGKIFTVVMLALVAASCRKEEELDLTPPYDLGGTPVEKTAIDQWLLDSLTTPYNIAVKYRWEPFELSLDQVLTPPDESKIIDAMSAIKRVWIDPYNAQTGSDLFIKKYSPKQFHLVGSVQYSGNGTVLLGQAEGGNNIAFFDINQNFDKDNASSIRRMILTSHHEFAHILHQNVLYPPEFKGISTSLGLKGYTATWFNIDLEEARQNGYITSYSMASADEDFVEMVANMLMEGRTKFNEIVASVDAIPRESLRNKEQFVVNYFRDVWNIDFYALQTKVQAALNAQITPPVLADVYGFGKTYTVASFGPYRSNILPQRVSFMNLYNSSTDAVAALPGYGLVMDSMAVRITAANRMVLRMYIRQNENTLPADFTYDMSVVNGVYTFTYVSASANGTIVQSAVSPLVNYFSGNQFAVSWYADPTVSIYARIKFSPVSTPLNYYLGLLLP